MIEFSSHDQALRVEEISTDSGFMRLRDSWNCLADRVAGHVFLRHEWFSAAWAWRKNDAALWIVCVFSDDRLVGALPLVRLRHIQSGSRVLEFLCVPDSQWCDVLIDPDAGPSVGHALVHHIVAKSPLWDVLRLERLAANSQVQNWLIPALVARGLAAQLEPVARNLFVDLKLPWEGYHRSLSRSIKKTRNLAANRLARAGTAHTQWITSTTVDPQQSQSWIDEVVSVSAQSWKRTTGNSLDQSAPQAFIRTLTETAIKANWLSVWFLRLDGIAVAMEYQLIFKGRVYALRADFDNSLRNMSPGTYLNYCMLEELFTKELDRYYMGPGNNPYKARWTGHGDKVYTMTSYAPTIRGRASSLWSETKLRLRELRDRRLVTARAE